MKIIKAVPLFEAKFNADNIPDENKGGDCYRVAYNTLMKNPKNYTLVHAVVNGQGPLEGLQFIHAFVIDEEKDVVIDNTQKNEQNRVIPTGLYFWIGKIEKYKEYSYEEAMKKAAETGVYGPWDPMFDDYM